MQAIRPGKTEKKSGGKGIGGSFFSGMGQIPAGFVEK